MTHACLRRVRFRVRLAIIRCWAVKTTALIRWVLMAKPVAVAHQRYGMRPSIRCSSGMGRAESLEDQAAGPVTNPIEMGMKSWDDVVKRLESIEGYKKAFADAFGGNAISKDTATKAIAAYERTSDYAKTALYDKYTTGEKAAMTDQQVRGMNKVAELGCTSCHSGPAFQWPWHVPEIPC